MKTKKTGFTLVELLVVIAIIGILIGMLLPAVQQVREAARRTQCMNNVRQIALGIMNYESSFQVFPPGWITHDGVTPIEESGWGWSAIILPHMEGQNLHNLIDFDVAIDDHFHEDTIQETLSVYLCPSEQAPVIINLNTHIDEHDHEHILLDDDDHDHDEELLAGRSNYSGVFGDTEVADSPGAGTGSFFANSKIGFQDIKDGSSNTLLVGERTNEFGTISWVGVVPEIDEPASRIVGAADHAPNDPEGHFEDFRSYHPGGASFVLGDGSTHFIRNTIDEFVFQSLSTIKGGEVVSIE